ncbi:hypothetical protein LXL04_025775 [Taraxacum kok-saghyz]
MVSIVVPVRSSVRLTSPRMQTKKECKGFRWALILATFLQGGVKNARGALCVLQEAGEDEQVLQIDETLLKERLPKSFTQDVVLAMALSYVEIPRDTMALSPPDYIKGCELLERETQVIAGKTSL